MTHAKTTRWLVTCAWIALASCGGGDEPPPADDDDAPSCGDGIAEGTEECDDGNGSDTDACTSACLNAICGDGFVFADGEACDDGNTADGDGCSASCEVESACGDGVVDDGEQCDFADARCVGCAYTGTCADCEATAAECLDSSGAALQTECFMATGTAAAGPGAGAAKSVLCASVIQCARESGCAAEAAETCWCGDVEANTCIQGGAAGPCRAEIEAAAETTDGMTIATRFVDPAYALGDAIRLLRCDQEACAAACF